jgi:hypothetical protein
MGRNICATAGVALGFSAAFLTSLLIMGQATMAQDIPVPGTSPAAPPSTAPDAEKFGLAPVDNSHQFLRQESVLLKPCQWQMDVGLNYTLFDHRFTSIAVPVDVNNPLLVETQLRQRLLVMPLQVRYGLMDRVQVFADMPVGWTNTETSAIGAASYVNQGGIGDATTGLSWLARKSDGWYGSPDIIATFACTAPTSDSNLYDALFGTPQTTLGQGVWAGAWNVLFVHSYDPITVFYGFGGRHAFTRSISGFDVQPGDQYTYRGGLGFAVNDRISLSSMLYGYYITQARLEGQQVPGTVQEPVYLRFAVTMMQRCDRICEPFAEIGMTDDAANARFGVTWTF